HYVPQPFGGLHLRRVTRPDPAWYLALFREVGEDWLWFGRLTMPADDLVAILHDPRVDVFELACETGGRGLLELDRREFPEIEVVYFGLTPELIGKGAGAWLISQALAEAWAHSPSRVWVHTCTLDHPGAVRFYMRAGFMPYKRAIEVARDPRLIGVLPL